MPAFPTRGYSGHLLNEVSLPGAEGFSSFHAIHHIMSPLPSRRYRAMNLIDSYQKILADPKASATPISPADSAEKWKAATIPGT